jgi:hypothetical protein
VDLPREPGLTAGQKAKKKTTHLHDLPVSAIEATEE